jgi:hypothetical protein
VIGTWVHHCPPECPRLGKLVQLPVQLLRSEGAYIRPTMICLHTGAELRWLGLVQ